MRAKANLLIEKNLSFFPPTAIPQSSGQVQGGGGKKKYAIRSYCLNSSNSNKQSRHLEMKEKEQQCEEREALMETEWEGKDKKVREEEDTLPKYF